MALKGNAFYLGHRVSMAGFESAPLRMLVERGDAFHPKLLLQRTRFSGIMQILQLTRFPLGTEGG